MKQPLRFLDKRQLPTLAQWLDSEGDGTRADGFSEWQSLEDFIRRELERDGRSLTDHEMSFWRLWKGYGIATIELCNIEWKRGRKPEELAQMMPRVAAAMVLYAFASILKEDTPWRSIARVIIEEMRFGVNEAADQLIESFERDKRKKK
jgi:hypothetical protein